MTIWMLGCASSLRHQGESLEQDPWLYLNSRERNIIIEWDPKVRDGFFRECVFSHEDISELPLLVSRKTKEYFEGTKITVNTLREDVQTYRIKIVSRKGPPGVIGKCFWPVIPSRVAVIYAGYVREMIRSTGKFATQEMLAQFLATAIVHEAGHAIGLSHTLEENVVMSSRIGTFKKVPWHEEYRVFGEQESQ